MCLLLIIYVTPSTTGRFIQPDQFIQDVYNPQDFNRYAYVRNNPYKYVDPTGQVAVGFQGLSGTSLSTDVEAIAAQISAQNIPIKTFPQGRLGEFRAKLYIEKQLRENPNQPIVIYGHSLGGVSAVRLSEKLGKEGLEVDQLITIDPVSKTGQPFNIEKPQNVMIATNFLQLNPQESLHGGQITGSENIDLTYMGATHTNIDKNEIVQGVITSGTAARHRDYQGVKPVKQSFWQRTKAYFSKNSDKKSN